LCKNFNLWISIFRDFCLDISVEDFHFFLGILNLQYAMNQKIYEVAIQWNYSKIKLITIDKATLKYKPRAHHGRIVVKFITSYAISLSPLTLWVWILLRRGVLATTICNKVWQWLAAGLWFSPCTPIKLTATI
jgi:hypothetical protein